MTRKSLALGQDKGFFFQTYNSNSSKSHSIFTISLLSFIGGGKGLGSLPRM